MKVGRVVYGSIDHIVIRKDPNVKVEIGMIVYTQQENNYLLYQIYDMKHESLMESRDIESLAYTLDKYNDVEIIDKDMKYYVLMYAKPLVMIFDNKISNIKSLPHIYSPIYALNQELAEKLLEHFEGVDLGKIRSGNDVLNVRVPIDLRDALTHHILITATTGRGKSNLMKVLLWKILEDRDVGLVVMDPHDEYITKDLSIKDHNKSDEMVIYYTSAYKKYFPNTYLLKVNISLLKPWHFLNVFDFSEAQQQAMYLAYYFRKDNWISSLLGVDDELYNELKQKGVKKETYDVLKRKLMFHLNAVLNMDEKENMFIYYESIFSDREGEGFLNHILNSLEDGKKIIIDTSELTTSEELLVMSLIAEGIFERYKRYKKEGILDQKAKVGIVLEEAPRVLNNYSLTSDGNIFGMISREGRKFGIGLIAITQLPSMIPDEILANMNTKVILGIEMQKERSVIINSSPHDLSKDSLVIASLNKGEAIISSIFTPFPIPIRVYNFEDIVKDKKGNNNVMFSGINRELEI